VCAANRYERTALLLIKLIKKAEKTILMPWANLKYKKAAMLLELETSESGILISIDTPDDYKLHFKINPYCSILKTYFCYRLPVLL